MKRMMLGAGLLLFSLVLITTSCGKDRHLKLSTNCLVFAYSGGNDMFLIKADCDWNITGIPNWITITPTSGSKDTYISVNVDRNNTSVDRSAFLTVTSENNKYKKEIEVFQTKVDISAIVNRLWFARTEERWDVDYWNNVIPESYRSWTFYSDTGNENWFFFFYNDSLGYEIHTLNNDTTYYAYHFVYEPDVDSLFISFELEDNEKEDYHTIIHQLDGEVLVFSTAYRPHQFEKITAYNVTGNEKKPFKPNPKKIASKPKGWLIPVK